MIFSNIDIPNAENATAIDGWVMVSGWAAAADPISEIILTVNGCHPISASLGDRRPDVESSYPACVMAQYSGFKAYVRVEAECADSFQLGLHIKDARGNKLEYVRNLKIRNTSANFANLSSSECPNCNGDGVLAKSDIKYGPYSLHRCSRCGFGAVFPTPSSHYLADYYNTIYWQQAVQRPSKNAVHPDFENIHAFVKEFNPTASRVYECGCGPATLLAGFKRAGYEVFGQDYSIEAAKIAMELFDITVNVAPLSELPDWPCDVVVLRHVIEHSTTPCDDLGRVFSMLRGNGIVLVVTPNMDSLQALLMKEDWEWFTPPAHMGFFSPRSFSDFAKTRNISLRHLETREGDGAPSLLALRHYAIRRESHLEPWERSRLATVIEQLARHENNQVLNTLGLGNEVIAVFQKRQ